MRLVTFWPQKDYYSAIQNPLSFLGVNTRRDFKACFPNNKPDNDGRPFVEGLRSGRKLYLGEIIELPQSSGVSHLLTASFVLFR